jgi:O-antigen/teichoic acid export membrane protein
MWQAAPLARATLFFGRLPDLVARAGRTGLWPLVDQGVVSAGNFITLVLVARALPTKGEYGWFGLLLECIFYLNTLQSALITYPLTVKGAVADADRLRRLATASLLMTLILAAPVALAGLGIASITGKVMLGLAGAFALVAWQVQEVMRKSLIAHFRYADAAWGDALRYLGTAACVWFAWRAGLVTLTSVFLIIGAFSAGAIVVQALQVGLRRISPRDLLDLAREFWRAGQWMLLSSISALVISLCGVWTLSLFHGTDAVGQFYAVANFTKPINPILITFCGLIVQHAARAYDSGGIRAARAIALKLSAGACALTLPYLLLLILVPGPALRLFYGAGSHFRDPIGERALQLFAISFVLLVFMSLTGALLNGVHRTRETFVAQIVNSLATVAVALPLTIYYGLLGMILGGIAAAVVQLTSLLWFFGRATPVQN